jgi:hypothetical protein
LLRTFVTILVVEFVCGFAPIRTLKIKGNSSST